MCSTCCTLGELENVVGNQFLVATGVLSRPCGRLGEENIKVNLRKNEFGVYSCGIRRQLNETGNFEQVLGHQVFKSLAVSWSHEFECK